MLAVKIQKWMYADGQHNDEEVLCALLNIPHHDIVDKILFSFDLEEDSREEIMAELKAMQEDLMAF